MHLASLLLAALVVHVACTGLVACYASAKGYPPFPIFLATLFLGFPLPLLLLALAPYRGER